MDDDESSVGGGIPSDAYRKHLNRQLGIADDDDDNVQSSPQKGQSAYYAAEIQRLRDALSTTSQGPVEAKYLEQVKKNRELLVKLESERAKVSKLTARIVVLEKEKLDAKDSSQQIRSVNLPSQRGTAAGAASVTRIGALGVVEESLEERLEKATKTIQMQRMALDDQKRDNQRIRRVLQMELGGDEEQVDGALKSFGDSASGSTGWKGRAQQIVILKGKLKDMERAIREKGDTAITLPIADDDDTMTVKSTVTCRTAVTGTTTKDYDDVNRSVVEVRQKRQQVHSRELQMKVDEKSREAEEERRKGESLQARLQILERDNQHLRNCLQRMIEKTENDDKLIAAYKLELEEKRTEIRRASTAGVGSVRSTLQQASQETIERLERENGQLLSLVAEMRQSNAKVTPTQFAWSAPDDVMTLVEEQRRTILALETQMQRRDKITSSHFETAKGCDLVLRDENAALKYRIKAVTEMMDKEIALHEAMAAEKVAAVQAASDAVSAATGGFTSLERDPSTSSLPPIGGGSRPTSTSSTQQKRGSKNDILDGRRGSNSSGPRQEEFDVLKKQYDELKRAFNTHQSRALK